MGNENLFCAIFSITRARRIIENRFDGRLPIPLGALRVIAIQRLGVKVLGENMLHTRLKFLRERGDQFRDTFSDGLFVLEGNQADDGRRWGQDDGHLLGCDEFDIEQGGSLFLFAGAVGIDDERFEQFVA